MSCNCSHSKGIDYNNVIEEIKARSESNCDLCETMSSDLWACLQKSCLFVGCGKQKHDHIGQHNQDTKHHASLSLKKFEIWCLACGKKIRGKEELQGKHEEQFSVSYQEMDIAEDKREKRTQLEIEDLDDLEQGLKPRGLCGLTNMGNTCFMNSALQSLSNCPPLTQFFLKCDAFVKVQEGSRSNVSLTYGKLMHNLWDKKRQKCVTPQAFTRMFRSVYSHFRGFAQQDSQEFLRCLMDRLHEELKRPIRPMSLKSHSLDNGADQPNHQSTKLLGGNSSMEEESSNMEIDSEFDTENCRERVASQEDMEVNDNIENESSKQDGNGTIQFHSIITEIFDGQLLSSVQCLTCNRVSTKIETFQDLSLPIPGKDDLVRIHSQCTPIISCSSAMYDGKGWIMSFWDWMKSWLVGPQVTLQDCLAAFFANDELKGDNMYNCEKCNKLRNGVKYSRVESLPEVFCIHLKRFRHEMYFSSKINSFVLFPLTGLEMQPFLSKDFPSKCTSYDLVAVITHFGSVGAGHYVAYAKNCINKRWYEFNDSWVSEVYESQVANAEAYVLFYSKKDSIGQKVRGAVHNRMNEDFSWKREPGVYISQEWFTRFETCAEPGQISNFDLLCRHGAVSPCNSSIINKLVIFIPTDIWESLQSRFGGGPKVTSLKECELCKKLEKRRKEEYSAFTKLHDEFQKDSDPDVAYCLSISWYKKWNAFAKGDDQDPPCPIDNFGILEMKDGITYLKDDADYGLVSPETWQYLYSVYGGGPEFELNSSEKDENGEIKTGNKKESDNKNYKENERSKENEKEKEGDEKDLR